MLEPISDIRVEVPAAYHGDVLGDLNSRRAQVLGTDTDESGVTTVHALVPTAEVLRYAIDLAGRLHVRDAGIELDPADLVREYSPVGFTTTGLVNVQIDALELLDGFPVALDGHLVWTEAGVTEPVSLALGRLEVMLGQEADRITGEVSNDGDTRVAGRLALSATREYSLDLQVTPGGEASPEVFDFLKSWGQPGQGGGVRLVFFGEDPRREGVGIGATLHRDCTLHHDGAVVELEVDDVDRAA